MPWRLCIVLFLVVRVLLFFFRALLLSSGSLLRLLVCLSRRFLCSKCRSLACLCSSGSGLALAVGRVGTSVRCLLGMRSPFMKRATRLFLSALCSSSLLSASSFPLALLSASGASSSSSSDSSFAAAAAAAAALALLLLFARLDRDAASSGRRRDVGAGRTTPSKVSDLDLVEGAMACSCLLWVGVRE